MAKFTHWVCFECRKSFGNFPNAEQSRKCLECKKLMADMGIYFEPPRRQAKKAWAVMQLLAENGYKFQTEGNKAFIEWEILASKRPRIEDVKQRIEQDKRESKERK